MTPENDPRLQAALSELMQINLMLTQRCVAHAGEIAVRDAEIGALKAKVVEPTSKSEAAPEQVG